VDDPIVFEGLNVTLSPKNYGGSGGNFWINVPTIKNKIPDITLSIPTIGQTVLNVEEFERGRKATRDGRIESD